MADWEQIPQTKWIFFQPFLTLAAWMSVFILSLHRQHLCMDSSSLNATMYWFNIFGLVSFKWMTIQNLNPSRKVEYLSLGMHIYTSMHLIFIETCKNKHFSSRSLAFLASMIRASALCCFSALLSSLQPRTHFPEGHCILKTEYNLGLNFS